MRKALLVLAILGFVSSLLLKEWVTAALWFIVILQDLHIAELEDEE